MDSFLSEPALQSEIFCLKAVIVDCSYGVSNSGRDNKQQQQPSDRIFLFEGQVSVERVLKMKRDFIMFSSLGDCLSGILPANLEVTPLEVYGRDYCVDLIFGNFTSVTNDIPNSGVLVSNVFVSI